MYCFTASIDQTSYRVSSSVVRVLNVSSLLSAYQAKLLEDMGKLLERNTPFSDLWKQMFENFD